MHPLGPLSPPDWHLALRDARRLQAEHLRALFQPVLASLNSKCSIPDLDPLCCAAELQPGVRHCDGI